MNLNANTTLLTLLVSLLGSGVFASDLWWKSTVRETPHNYFYIGISEGKKELQAAMREAYNEALKEAVRHQYGFDQKYVESFYSTLEEARFSENFSIKQDDIQIKGIKPGRFKIIEKDDHYLVYREIEYPKKSILKEKLRLKSLDKKDHILNQYGDLGKNHGKLTVRTDPKLAEVVITDHTDTFQVTGTSNGVFYLPMGVYNVTVRKPGSEVDTREVFISGTEKDLFIILEPTYGSLKFDIEPMDSLVTIDGVPVNSHKTLRLQTQKDYVVNISHPDYFTREETINISMNQNLTLQEDLIPRPGRFTLFTQPGNADVYINGNHIGKSPIKRLQLEAGRHDITIEKNNYEKIKKVLKIKPNANHRPLVFKMEYKDEHKVKPEKDIPSYAFDVSDSSFDFNNHNISVYYLPGTARDQKTVFNILPFGAEFFQTRYISIGGELIGYFYSQKKEEEGEYGVKYDYDQEETNITANFNTKIYLYNCKSFNVSFGPEFNYYYAKTERNQPADPNEWETLHEEKYSSLGGSMALKIPVNKIADDETPWGFRFQVQRVKLTDSKTNRFHLGIYWDS
jgi:hypothetical protein